jgi:signal transduction histidine kinase
MDIGRRQLGYLLIVAGATTVLLELLRWLGDAPFLGVALIVGTVMALTGLFLAFFSSKPPAVSQELSRANRALTVRSACNRTLVRAENEAAFLADICRIIVDVGGYRLAWVGFIDAAADDLDQETKRVYPLAQRGYEDGYLESVKICWDESEHGRGPTGTAIRTHAPVVVRNILADPTFSPWRSEAKQRGFSSVIALPLADETEILGALTIYAVEQDAFDAEEVALLSDLADDLAYGIATLRARAQHEIDSQALSHFESKAHALLDAMPDTMMILKASGECLDIRTAKDGNAWQPPGEFKGQHLSAILPQAVSEKYMHHLGKTLRYDRRQVFEYKLAANGSTHSFEARIVKMREDRVLAIVRDISERKAHEAIIEEERERIARDLHDGLAQNLYFLGLKIDFLAKQVLQDPETTHAELTALKKTVQANIHEIRRTIFALRPVNLDAGFDVATRTYVREFGEQAGLQIDYSFKGSEDDLPSSLEPVLFRLVQEALNNVAKHAGCSQAWVELTIHPAQVVVLEIQDNGIGFKAERLPTANGAKLGLSQMRDRVAAVGGPSGWQACQPRAPRSVQKSPWHSRQSDRLRLSILQGQEK